MTDSAPSAVTSTRTASMSGCCHGRRAAGKRWGACASRIEHRCHNPVVSDVVPVLVSGLSGAAVTLAGVFAGGVVSSRSQRRQWLRDTQLEACVAVVQEAARIQIGLADLYLYEARRLSETRRLHFPRGKSSSASPKPTLDWTAWNQTLYRLWAVAPEATRNSARQIDGLFWECRYRIEHQSIRTDDDWSAARDLIEAAQVSFIDTFRRDVVGAKPVQDGPVARPPITELQARYQGEHFTDSSNH